MFKAALRGRPEKKRDASHLFFYGALGRGHGLFPEKIGGQEEGKRASAAKACLMPSSLGTRNVAFAQENRDDSQC